MKTSTQKMNCSRPGLRIIMPSTSDKDEAVWEIDLTDSEMRGKYTFHFSYKKHDEFFSGMFKIPIK